MSRVLLVGGTGNLGCVIGATLLTGSTDHVVLAARAGHQYEDIVARLRMEMSASGDPQGRSLERLEIVRLPQPGDTKGFADLFSQNRIDEVINSAGSVHYFDVARLKLSNIDLVNDLLTAAKTVPLRRFIHVSTAFACGYINGVAKEELFEEPPSDPTEYTRYRRRAEWLVAESGVPYMILRPSIVIGDSRDGHYFGAPSGVYQFWQSTAKILMNRYHPTLYAVASEQKLQLLHQDAFAATLMAARQHFSDNAIVNVVSSPDVLITVEDLWRLWSDRVMRPHELKLYRSIEDAPMQTLDPRMRAFHSVTSVNLDISSRNWNFETRNRDRLIEAGLNFPEATKLSFLKCMNRFVASSELVRSYYARFSSQFPDDAVQTRIAQPAAI